VSGRGLDLAQEAFGFIESLDDLQSGRAVLAAMDRAFALFGFENFRSLFCLTASFQM
jgi:LuxR family transcriptional regulator, quorum-sensing system regulator BjaR1